MKGNIVYLFPTGSAGPTDYCFKKVRGYSEISPALILSQTKRSFLSLFHILRADQQFCSSDLLRNSKVFSINDTASVSVIINELTS